MAGILAVALLGLSACKEASAAKKDSTPGIRITVSSDTNVVTGDSDKPISVGGTTLTTSGATINVVFGPTDLTKDSEFSFM